MIKIGDHFNGERSSNDQPVQSFSRYNIGTLVAIILTALAIYWIMQVVLERHSIQQRISFLTSTQFIKFQQLANAARALMHASADNAIPEIVLDRLTEDMNQKIAEMHEVGAQLDALRRQLGEDTTQSDLNIRLRNFLVRAERLGEIGNASRGRRYSFWGPIDFATAADSFIMRRFQEEIQKSFAKSEASIAMAKRISALLILSLVIGLIAVGVFILHPLLARLRAEHERKKLIESKLSILAHKDSLTDIPNRVSFNKMLNGLITEQSGITEGGEGSSFSLFLVDLDHFKAVNDNFGHPIGDRLLVEAARRLVETTGSSGTTARLGGDEFAILAPHIGNVQQAEELAARIRNCLAMPFVIDGHSFTMSGSIGGAIFPRHADCSMEIIRCADLALYAAKSKRNNLTIFNEEMMADRIVESRLRTALSRAVENNEFIVYYQPKIDIRDGSHAGFEALIRWQHPELGILAPGSFLHLLDTASAMISLTECVVDQVAADIRRWHGAGLFPGRVAINMPEALLISVAGYDMLAAAIERHALNWSDFAIEITEDVFVNKYMEQILTSVARMREHGVSIDLDDFGTGFASLTNLRTFPFDDIKIDRSFVSDIGSNKKSEEIIKAMINLVTSLERNCIAEGVETEAQLHFLMQAGCGVAQGYLFGKPVPYQVATAGLIYGKSRAHWRGSVPAQLAEPSCSSNQ